MSEGGFASDPRFAALADRFRQRAVREAQELGEALESGDHERVRFVAHSLAGAAGTFGFDEISELARPLDEAAGAGASIDQLERLAGPLFKAIEAINRPR